MLAREVYEGPVFITLSVRCEPFVGNQYATNITGGVNGFGVEGKHAAGPFAVEPVS